MTVNILFLHLGNTHSLFEGSLIILPCTLTKCMGKMLDGYCRRLATCYFEQIQDVTPHRTAAVKPLTSHLTNHSNTTNNMQEHCWRSKNELINNVLLWTSTHGRAGNDRPGSTLVYHLNTDTGCRPKGLTDRESVNSVLSVQLDDDNDDNIEFQRLN